MRCVLQRVRQASVRVDDQTVGAIDSGLMVLVGVGQGDTEEDVAYLVAKTLGLRIFNDDAGKMNRSILDVGGQVLAISQFTLFGDCRKGRRPSFIAAAQPDRGKQLYETYCQGLRAGGLHVETGIFAADMQVSLTNDGPVTILLDSQKNF